MSLVTVLSRRSMGAFVIQCAVEIVGVDEVVFEVECVRW